MVHLLVNFKARILTERALAHGFVLKANGQLAGVNLQAREHA